MIKRCLLLLWVTGLAAADEPLALVNATLPGGVRRTVVIRDGRIQATAEIPAGTRTVNLQGLHLYPGMMESDSLLGLMEIESVRGSLDHREVGENNADLRPELAFNPDSELLPVARSAGILSVALQPSAGLVTGQVALMSLWGWTREDMSLADSPGLVVAWPRWDAQQKEESKARQSWDAKIHQLDDWVEEARAWQALPAAQRPIRPDLESLARVVGGQGRLFVRAYARHQIESAQQFCQRHKLSWVLVGGAEAVPCAAALKADGVDVIYTETFRLPQRDYEAFDTYYRVPSQLSAAGLRVALAGPGSHDNARWLPEMAAMAWAHGWTEEEAVAAITRIPSQIFGLSQGTLEPGATATLIATDRPLLDRRARVVRAWVRGQEIPLDDRQKRLYQKYQNRE